MVAEAPRKAPASLPAPAVQPTAPPKPGGAATTSVDPNEHTSGTTLALFGLFTLMFTVPVAELASRFAHFYVPILPAVELVLTAAVAFSGRLGRFWESKIARPWVVLLLLFVAAALFGQYPKRSLIFIAQYGLRFHLFPFYCCALVISTRHVRYCMFWLCCGAVLLLVICLTAGQLTVDQRFYVLPESSLANPNDLAFWLMISVASLTYWLYSSSLLLRGIWAITTSALIYYILKTGSRANFLTLIVVAAVMFITASRRFRIGLLLVAPITVVLAFLTLPSYTIERLTLVLMNPEQGIHSSEDVYGAVSSQMARTELQERAIELSVHHPLLGVGATMFEDAVDEMVRAESGKKSGWQAAHNTYLEIAAEDGMLAGLIFVWIMFMCLRMNYVSYRTCKRNPWQQPALGASISLLLLTVASCVGLAFNNSSYSPQIDMLVGLTVANFMAVRKESRLASGAAPVSSVPALA